MQGTAGVAVRASGLVKRYGELVAVGGVDLEVRRGTCLALLGPNGAGKTTTIEILEGLKRADGGLVEVLGLDWERAPREIRARIGVQLQETQLQDNLTALETVRLFRSFYPRGRAPLELLEQVGLSDKRGTRVVSLSGGQKQRLTLACAFVNDPELLFLDEPTTGLDPQARRRVWEIIAEFKQRGGTVLLTTHYMEEAERLADELVVVDRGQVIARGTPASLVASLGAEVIVELEPRAGTAAGLDPAELEAQPEVRSLRREGASFVLTLAERSRGLARLLLWLDERGVELEDLHTHRPTLEDVFVSITGKHLRE